MGVIELSCLFDLQVVVIDHPFFYRSTGATILGVNGFQLNSRHLSHTWKNSIPPDMFVVHIINDHYLL